MRAKGRSGRTDTDWHELRNSGGGRVVVGAHRGEAFAINDRGAFSIQAASLGAARGLGRAAPGRPLIPAPDAAEDPAGPAPSVLVGILESDEPTPSSRAAADAIRGMAGPWAASRAIDAILPVWGFHDARALERMGDAERHRLRAEAAVLGRIMPWGAARQPAEAYLRAVAPPSPLHPIAPGRFRRLLAAGRPFATEAELKAVLSLPADWDPREPADREALRRLADAYAGLADLMGGYAFLAFARGRYAEAESRLGADGMAGEAGAIDAADALAGQLVAPALEGLGLARPCRGAPSDGSPSRRVAARILYGAKGLPAILETARRWHRSPVSRLPSGPPLAWDAPYPDARAPNGVAIAWLASSTDLAAEGAPLSGGGLQHCVASYALRCAEGRSAIASLRGAGARRLSTAELDLDASGGPRPRQHRGALNGDPPPEAVEALDWFTAEVEAGRIARRPIRVGRRIVGVGPAAGALAGWTRLLPRPARGAGFTDAVIVEADALVRARFHGGWDALPAGRVLPDASTPWNISIPHGGRRTDAVAEIAVALDASLGGFRGRGIPRIAALACAGAGTLAVVASALLHLAVSLDLIAGSFGAPGPWALLIAAGAGTVAAVGGTAVLLSATATIARRAGAAAIRRRAGRARTRLSAGAPS